MLLSQVVNIKSGYPFRGRIPEVSGTGVQAIQMKDVSIETGITWQTAVETELPGKREPGYLLPGNILFTIRGNRNYAVLVDESANAHRAVASPHFFILSCTSETVLSAYLVWLLNQGPLKRYFKRESEGTLTKGIRRSVLENAPIAVPPLEKQRKIVALAQAAGRERKLFERLICNNETMLDMIATDLLGGCPRTSFLPISALCSKNYPRNT
ncbi:MAG: restriction endonuclease subunit S [Pseudomonadota bacterium]|nr:restriction endonuclease subunit S [Pseudomonadota bacterium]